MTYKYCSLESALSFCENLLFELLSYSCQSLRDFRAEYTSARPTARGMSTRQVIKDRTFLWLIWPTKRSLEWQIWKYELID